MSDLWIPRSADELETALRDRTVVENHYLEMKQFERSGKVPPTIARSVAGLAIDGGVLVIGAKEIKKDRRFEPEPRALAGLPEAVDQIIATRVAPPVRVSVRTLDRDDDTGYLVVIVPPSARAPHMVDGHYLARDGTTTRELQDVEVRRIWQRNFERREDLRHLLHEEVAREPERDGIDATARVFVVAQPVSADPRLLLDEVPERDLLKWIERLRSDPVTTKGRRHGPSLAHASRLHRRAHGCAFSTMFVGHDRTIDAEDRQPDDLAPRVLDVEIREDGGIRLYSGAGSKLMYGVQHVDVEAAVGYVGEVLGLARLISTTAAFHGSWQLGVALRGLRSRPASYPWKTHPQSTQPDWLTKITEDGTYSEDGYDEMVEVDGVMLTEPGSPVIEALLGRLLRTTMGSIEHLAEMDSFALDPPPEATEPEPPDE